MPVKRRTAKFRRQLDGQLLEDLFYGPGTCLFNGDGYLGPHGDGMWRDKSDHVQSEVVTAMRSDWERHRELILKAWRSRTAHDLGIARRFHGDPAVPWAALHFDQGDQS